MRANRLTGVLQIGVGGGVVLGVVFRRVAVLVPVANQRLRVVRVLMHCFCSGKMDQSLKNDGRQSESINNLL